MDQLIGAAIVTVIVIFVIVGVVRAIRRRGGLSTSFGAGGSSTVPPGTHGVVKSALAPSGIVRAAGEDWTARSASGGDLAPGQHVVVVAQDGLVLIVDPDPSAGIAQG